MIVRTVEKLPAEVDLLPLSLDEWLRATEFELGLIERRSQKKWEVLSDAGVPLLYAGVRQLTASSIPEFWIMVCTAFAQDLRKNLCDARKKFEEVVLIEFPHVKALVNCNSDTAVRFARFFGFREYDLLDETLIMERWR